MRTVRITLRGLIVACAGLALAACGSGEDEAEPKPAPTIPESTATQLASQSERVAATLEAGEICEAAERADVLAAAVEDARGEIPAALHEQAEDAARELVDNVNCPEPVFAPPPVEPDEDKKKEKEQDKQQKEEPGKGDDKGKGRSGGPPGLEKKGLEGRGPGGEDDGGDD